MLSRKFRGQGGLSAVQIAADATRSSYRPRVSRNDRSDIFSLVLCAARAIGRGAKDVTGTRPG